MSAPTNFNGFTTRGNSFYNIVRSILSFDLDVCDVWGSLTIAEKRIEQTTQIFIQFAESFRLLLVTRGINLMELRSHSHSKDFFWGENQLACACDFFRSTLNCNWHWMKFDRFLISTPFFDAHSIISILLIMHLRCEKRSRMNCTHEAFTFWIIGTLM